MNDHGRWLEFADIYSTGALDGSERAEFETHLSACAVCAERVRETADLLSEIPQGMPLLEPSPEIRARLMAQIGTEAAPAAAGAWRAALSALGALALAAAAVFLNWNQPAVRRYFFPLEASISKMTSSEARVVELKAPAAGSPASGRLLWDPASGKGVFLAAGLAELPQGAVYELWAIAGTEPVAAGTFRVDRSGRAVLNVPPIAAKRFEKFAVTLEPREVPKPTGPMVLVGALG